jgi:RNA polymerase sigma-70 factor (ECF subfamily)
VDSENASADELSQLLDAVERREVDALAKLLAWTRTDLLPYVKLRLDKRLAARFDASDVLQEVQLSVSQRIDDYLQRRPMPFPLWLRKTALERLTDLRRHHLRQRRSAKAEANLPDHTSLDLVRSLAAQTRTPSQHVADAELARALNLALGELDDIDREILVMRQLESMPFAEIALVLDLQAANARKRFGRTLLKLQDFFASRGLLD